MDKKLSLKLNGGSHVLGIVWGFDPFIELVMGDPWMATHGNNNIGMVVTPGNSIVLEALEEI
ncbi:unnamed protein product [Nyctereutes procyonoides]|uniref:Sm protein G n=1 Tax=Nyctereutes procyonoides TaxID=34880 RepID=A0A811ZHV6_NYCPR|nr:unnamed protein product [Nyctereutes procyonoides]